MADEQELFVEGQLEDLATGRDIQAEARRARIAGEDMTELHEYMIERIHDGAVNENATLAEAWRARDAGEDTTDEQKHMVERMLDSIARGHRSASDVKRAANSRNG